MKKSDVSLISRDQVVRVAKVVGAILIIPVLGNLFVEGWNWGFVDFVFAGILFFGTGLAIEFVSARTKNRYHKIAAIVSILVILFLIWVEVAVDAVSRFISQFW